MGTDNPTALADLRPETQFEIEASRIETFEEVEIAARITEAGAPLEMRGVFLEVQAASGGSVREIEMQPNGDGFEAHVVFFEPGEYDLRVMGTPVRHLLGREMGEQEIQVSRHHQVIGPYWIEMALSPAPAFEDTKAHIHLYAFELTAEGTRGPIASGLRLHGELHHPDGEETSLEFIEEESGEYETDAEFHGAGTYEVHLELETTGDEGEFHIPVLAHATRDDDTGGQAGGNQNGDGH